MKTILTAFCFMNTLVLTFGQEDVRVVPLPKVDLRLRVPNDERAEVRADVKERTENRLIKVTDISAIPLKLPSGVDAGLVTGALMDPNGDIQQLVAHYRHQDYFIPIDSVRPSVVRGILELVASPAQFFEAEKFYSHRWPDIQSASFQDHVARQFPWNINESPVSALTGGPVIDGNLLAAGPSTTSTTASPTTSAGMNSAVLEANSPSTSTPVPPGSSVPSIQLAPQSVTTTQAGVTVTGVGTPQSPDPIQQQTSNEIIPRPQHIPPISHLNDQPQWIAPFLFGGRQAVVVAPSTNLSGTNLGGNVISGNVVPNWIGNSTPNVMYPNTTVIQNGGAIYRADGTGTNPAGVMRNGTVVPSAVFSNQANTVGGAGVPRTGNNVGPTSRYPAMQIRPTPTANFGTNSTAGGRGTAGAPAAGIGTSPAAASRSPAYNTIGGARTGSTSP